MIAGSGRQGPQHGCCFDDLQSDGKASQQLGMSLVLVAVSI
jgi:hypothetical protein